MKRSSLLIGCLLLTLPLTLLAIHSGSVQAVSPASARPHKKLSAKQKVKSQRLSAKSPRTSQPAQLQPLLEGVEVTPILTSGDILPSGYQMAGIPDGLGADGIGKNQFMLLMNHELTSAFGNISDARVSKLVIDKNTLEVKQGNYLIDGTEGYRRLCSATLSLKREGFSSPLFLTNEEATDGSKNGISIAVNPSNGSRTELPWLGHLSHENTVPISGYGKVVIITDDDNGTSTGPFNHLYMYIADSESDLLAGRGQLHVFVADNGKKSPADFPDKQTTLTGKFVPIDQAKNTDTLTLRTEADAKGSMIFVRPEDITYLEGSPKTVFFTTTGRSTYVNPTTGQPYDARGRVYQMKLDKTDPTKVVGLSVILNGDKGDDIWNPDNLATSRNSLMIQEDVNDEFRGTGPGKINHPGRVLRYDLNTKQLTPVAEIAQTSGIFGEWESSGIINASKILGPDTWLLDVQSHTLFTDYNGKQDESGQLLRLKVPGSAPIEP